MFLSTKSLYVCPFMLPRSLCIPTLQQYEKKPHAVTPPATYAVVGQMLFW